MLGSPDYADPQPELDWAPRPAAGRAGRPSAAAAEVCLAARVAHRNQSTLEQRVAAVQGAEAAGIELSGRAPLVVDPA